MNSGAPPHRLRLSSCLAYAAIWLTITPFATDALEVPPHITWTEDPATTATIAWQRDVPGRGTVQYGLTTNYGMSVSDAGGVRVHAITLRDLQPQTRYYYKVTSTDGYEPYPGRFVTAPVQAPTSTFRFAVHGDLQGGLTEEWARTAVTSIIEDDPDLVIHVGDMAVQDYDEDHDFSTWAQFFSLATDELERVVFMPTPGNHDWSDNPNAYWWRMFDLPPHPSGGSFYSYDVGNTHFIVLNSELDVLGQTNWLARDLQAAAYNTNTMWIVTYFHRPPYSVGEREGDEYIKTNWCPSFVRYEADIVFSGHSHNYQRTVPIRGVRYVVAGGGGGRLYWVNHTPGFHEFATSCYHFVSCNVTGAVLNYRAIRTDEQVFDTVALTNEGRFVRVAPAFPRRGETATIFYKAAGGPLASADPVYIHLGLDAFGSAVVDAPMTYNASSGRWEYEYVVAQAATNRIAFMFHDATWAATDNNYEHNWQALLDRVTFTPAVATAGTSVAVRYEADMGPLLGSGQVYLHIGFNGWKQVVEMDVPMTNTSGHVWECAYPVPDYATRVDVAFNNGTTWDTDYGRDWHAVVTGATGSPPWAPLPLVVPGTPVITTNPPSVQNNPGDNFDFNMTGTALLAKDAAGGFGDFGQTYFNYDSSNLYVGGISTDLGGSNNVFVLFLGLSTLTDDAWTLWHKSGLPNALDFLHNVEFVEPMDIAIVYGDEYGDEANYTNFTYGAYDFGQGIYYLGTNSTRFDVVAGARLSQFDGTGTVACATSDDDGGDRRTDRWEASLPWSSLNAAGGVTSVNYLLVAGVIGSSSTDGTNRYLSATYIGDRVLGAKDGYGQFARNFVTLTPVQIHLGHGDFRNDGVANAWRHEHFGSVQGPPGDEDADGDALSNWAEYVADTDPTNEASFFTAGGRGVGAGGFVLDWSAVPGRHYAVHRTTNMLESFVPLATNLTVGVYTDSVSGVERAFYSVGVKIAP